MRPPDIALTVLFPILIAIGIALGMDAVSPTEFFYARSAIALASLISIGLTMSWFYQADLSVPVAAMVFLTVGSIGTAWFGAMKWLDLKENTYCFITVDLGPPTFNGPYLMQATSNGPYPTINVRITIDGKSYNIGDVEPDLLRHLTEVPPLPGPGTYEIRIFGRTGHFREILTITQRHTQGWNVDRITLGKDGQPVLTPMQWP